MKLTRREAIAGASSLFATRVLAAADWPSRLIKIVVPFAAGGPTDFVARLLAEPLGTAVGQQVIIENRPGASGNLGAQAVADAEPDGYTLLHTTVATQALNPILMPSSKLRPLKDLVAVGTTAALPNVLVVQPKKIDASSVQQLVELGKMAPKSLNYGTFGHGTSPHILSLLLQRKAGFEAVAVAYRGSAPALTDLISGQIDYLFDNVTTSAEQIKAGIVRGLAITSASRSPVLPDLPTMKEAGFDGFDLNFGFSLMAPVRTPPAILTKLRSAFDTAVKTTSYANELRARGAEPLLVAQADLAGFVERETERWVQVAQQISLNPSN
jgi:tripartite-type tricarboxylate transporter receptor subunit TctC